MHGLLVKNDQAKTLDRAGELFKADTGKDPRRMTVDEVKQYLKRPELQKSAAFASGVLDGMTKAAAEDKNKWSPTERAVLMAGLGSTTVGLGSSIRNIIKDRPDSKLTRAAMLGSAAAITGVYGRRMLAGEKLPGEKNADFKIDPKKKKAFLAAFGPEAGIGLATGIGAGIGNAMWGKPIEGGAIMGGLTALGSVAYGAAKKKRK